MHRQRLIWLILLLTVGLLLFPATPALADGDPPGDNGAFIWNEDYTLEEGEQLDGDLVVYNGDVTLEAGSGVKGSVIIWNGSADAEGDIEGDLIVSSGDIYLGDSAWVGGDVVCSWNCDLEQQEGARVDGGIVEGVPLPGLRLENRGGFPVPVVSPPTLLVSGPGLVLNWTLRAIRTVVAVLVIAAVAGLVMLIWPQPTTRVGQAVSETPWPSLGIGLLTAAAATALIVALAITLCLSPIAAVVALTLGAASLFGWIGVGALVGERLLRTLNARGIAPLWAAGLGTLLITLIGMGLSGIACLAPLGWLMICALGCMGLGAVVLTRFGTTVYAPSTSLQPEARAGGSGHRPSHPTPATPATDKEPEPSEPQEEAGSSEP